MLVGYPPPGSRFGESTTAYYRPIHPFGYLSPGSTVGFYPPFPCEPSYYTADPSAFYNYAQTGFPYTPVSYYPPQPSVSVCANVLTTKKTAKHNVKIQEESSHLHTFVSREPESPEAPEKRLVDSTDENVDHLLTEKDSADEHDGAASAVRKPLAGGIEEATKQREPSPKAPTTVLDDAKTRVAEDIEAARKRGAARRKQAEQSAILARSARPLTAKRASLSETAAVRARRTSRSKVTVRQPTLRPFKLLQRKARELIERQEEAQRRHRRRKMLGEFKSRMYYHYELPTVCKLMYCKVPELMLPPCLSTTPVYQMSLSEPQRHL